MATMYVRGAKELRDQLRALEVAVEPAKLKPVLAEALKMLMDRARQRLLSVTKRAERLQEGWLHIEDAMKVQESKADVARAFTKVMRSKAPHGFWIEYGHAIRKSKTGLSRAWAHFSGASKMSTGGHVAARPYFRPALDEMKGPMRDFVKDKLNRLIIAAIKGTGATPAREEHEQMPQTGGEFL